MDYPVSAIAWSGFRASFVGESPDGRHRVEIRPVRQQRGAVLPTHEVLTDDPTEAGLRDALYRQARAGGKPSDLDKANPTWSARMVAKEFPELAIAAAEVPT